MPAGTAFADHGVPEEDIVVRLASLIQDLRYALRLLRHRPGHAIAAALTLALSVALVRYLATFLYGVRVYDGISFVVAPALVVMAAAAAAAIPARRAARVDPLRVLR